MNKTKIFLPFSNPPYVSFKKNEKNPNSTHSLSRSKASTLYTILIVSKSSENDKKVKVKEKLF